MVTGAAGLLGQNVVRQLLARGDEVVGVDNCSRFRMFGDERRQPRPEVLSRVSQMVFDDFASEYALRHVEDVDAVVHAAAQTSHPRSIDIPAVDFAVNAVGTLKLLDAIRHSKGKTPRLVNIGSAKIYNMEFGPDDLVESDTRIEPSYYATQYRKDTLVGESRRLGGFITPFGVSKLAADQLVSNFSWLYGLDACTIRPGCFTGKGSLACTLQNWAPILVRAMVRGETFKVFGYAGKQVRDLLHVDDLARLVLACLDHPAPWRGEAFNACGGVGRDISILEAVALIERLTGKRGELCFEAARPADWQWFIGDNTAAEVTLGWRPEIDLETIFRELCEEALDGEDTRGCLRVGAKEHG